MQDLKKLFKEYCHTKIRLTSDPLREKEKSNIIQQLKKSPFKSVVQAWTVLDLYNYKHLYAEGFDTCFGYENEAITAEKILDIVHPDDQEAFGKLYYLCLEGLMNMPIPTAGIGHFCISYRMKDAKGNYHKILETNNILACDKKTNAPLINLSQITLLKNIPYNKQVTYYFNIRDEHNSVNIMRNFLSQYSSKANIFTENELKIAKLLMQGHTSQQIAKVIFLSKHTIDKYRKKMLEKTECTNTPQLLAYMRELNLI